MTTTEYLDLVAVSLTDLPELEGIGVVVDKQQDVAAERKEYLAKSRGYAVLIGEVSDRVDGKENEGPRIKLVFGVTVYSPRIVTPPKKTGAALRDVIRRRLHGANLSGDEAVCQEISYKDGKPFLEKEGNRSRMIHAMAFEAVIQHDPHTANVPEGSIF